MFAVSALLAEFNSSSKILRGSFTLLEIKLDFTVYLYFI